MKTEHPGFTLVELLVVIAVIAILMAILLPVLGLARERTRLVGCLSNMKQMYTAFASYASENGGICPRACVGRSEGINTDLPHGNILTHLYKNTKYLDNPAVCRCPSDKYFYNDRTLRQSYSYWYENGIDRVKLGGPIDMNVWGFDIRTTRSQAVKLLHDGECFISRNPSYFSGVPANYTRHFKSTKENTLWHDGHANTRKTHWPDVQPWGNYYLGPWNWPLLANDY